LRWERGGFRGPLLFFEFLNGRPGLRREVAGDVQNLPFLQILPYKPDTKANFGDAGQSRQRGTFGERLERVAQRRGPDFKESQIAAWPDESCETVSDQ
jgi:hypothetical protein